MKPPGILPLLILGLAAAGADAPRVAVEAYPLAAGSAKAVGGSTTHELGYAVETETRYRILPDGRVEVHCAQNARPTFQGAVRERRLASKTQREQP
ncbi:MAG: hypothetical protein RML12_04575 [Xanthomonadales bacterium]|nr:hypothetical protein [Xanthomonadales bacterium]